MGSYSEWLILEFYTNLTSKTTTRLSPHYHQVFIRNSWYNFYLTVINSYLHRSALEEAFEPVVDLLASSLTHSHLITWPKGDISSNLLTTVYSVLFRFAFHNWLPNASRHVVTMKMASLLYKMQNRMSIDLGSFVFEHVMSFTPPKEAKVHLPYPCLILGILKEKGFKPYPNEPILAFSGKFTIDCRLFHGTHYDGRDSLGDALVQLPVNPPEAMSGSSSAPPDPASAAASDPVHPPALLQLKQAAYYYTTVDSLKAMISSLETVISSTEPKLVDVLRHITILKYQIAS